MSIDKELQENEVDYAREEQEYLEKLWDKNINNEEK